MAGRHRGIVEQLTFGTDGWRDVIAERFTFANVRRAAQAYADYLQSVGQGKALVLVGYDTRFLGREFAATVAGVLAGNGLRAAVSQTYLPTPALSFAVARLGAAGGVMLTASHNPARYGGFKLKGPYGGSATDDSYRAVAALVPTEPVPDGPHVDVPTFDIRDAYYRAVAALVDMEAIGRARPVIVHDAMGGAGCGWLTGLASFTGAFSVEPLRGRPDPLFHGVNPEPIAQNLGPTLERMAAVDTRARPGDPVLATVTDGDADRIGVVLPGGEYFNSHQIFAVLLDHLAQSRTGSVVKTFTVSRVVERLARARGLPVIETPVGFKHIVSAMLAGGSDGGTNRATDAATVGVTGGVSGAASPVLIGGEESGGIGVAGHIPERDAIANTLLLVEAVVKGGRSLARRFADIEAEVGWRHAYDRVDLQLDDAGVKERVMARLSGGGLASAWAPWQLVSVEDRDGVKLNLADPDVGEGSAAKPSRGPDLSRDVGSLEPSAWLLFRASGTEPVLRLYCEAQDRASVVALLRKAQEFVSSS